MIEKTFNVWYRLSELLFCFDDDGYLDKYKPYVNRLEHVLIFFTERMLQVFGSTLPSCQI